MSGGAVSTSHGFELSPRQRELWELVEGGRLPVRGRCVLEAEGEVDRDAVADALEALVRRYEILRTRFERHPDSGRILQCIVDPHRPVLGEGAVELAPRAWPGAEEVPESVVRPLVARWHGRRGGGRLELSLPLLCADAPTLELLAGGLLDHLAGAAGEEGEPLQYADLAAWQKDLLTDPDAASERDFWSRQPPLRTPGLEGAGCGADEEAEPSETLRMRLPVDLSAVGVEDLARRLQVAPASLLAAAWQLVLQRSIGADEVPLGVACDGRPYDELLAAAGPLARHLPLRGRLDEAASFAAAVQDVDRRWREVEEWQEYFSWELIDRQGSEPLPYALDYRELPASRGGDGVTWRVSRVEAAGDPFLLALVYRRSGNESGSELVYDPSRLSERRARVLGGRLGRLLTGASEAPERACGDLPLLDETELHRVLVEVAGDPRPRGPARSLDEPVAGWAAAEPQRIAVEGAGGSLTYGNLDHRANQLAHLLRGRGVGPEDRVALLLPPSPERVIAVLAVLRCGAAWVPLEATHPRARLELVLDDSQARCVVTTAELASLLPSTGVPVLVFDELRSELQGQPPGPPAVAPDPDRLAYVLYTSGTTGRPKGVMVPHRGVAGRIDWIQRHHPLAPGESVLHKASFAFDVSVREIFWPLTAGGCIVLTPAGDETDPRRLADLMRRHRVVAVHFVPSLLGLFLDSDPPYLPDLRHVISGGEELQPALRDRFVDRFDASLHNSYGPTEASIHATFRTCDGDRGRSVVPIGEPIAETSVLVLGPRLEPVPYGVPGELVLGGPGVARGYLGRPGLSAGCFVPHPRPHQPGERLYRTGDVARWLPDGTLHWLGRLDHQVKVHGQRIELGEVETRLEAHPAVRRAAVVVEEAAGDGRELVAYVVRDRTALPRAEDLREHLEGVLPAHAVPARFRALATLPLNANGKLDRSALADAAEEEDDDDRSAYVAPRNPVEEALALMWREALGVERISVSEDFFRAGGNSLLATQLFSRIRAAFRAELSLRELFEASTIEELARRLSESEPAPGQALRVAEALCQIKNRTRRSTAAGGDAR